MSDREVIVGLLKRVHGRRRWNWILKELSFLLPISLVVPILFKIADLVHPLGGPATSVLLSVWGVATAALMLFRLRSNLDLSETAASIDIRAKLHDEIKTAYWFLENPQKSGWIDAQIARAAATARRINIDTTCPLIVPKTSYIAPAMALLLVGAHFLPDAWVQNWLYLDRAPAATSSNTEDLQTIENRDESEAERRIDEILQNVLQGKLSAEEALRQLAALRSELAEEAIQVVQKLQLQEEDAQSAPQGTEASGVPKPDAAGKSGAEPPASIKGFATRLDVQLTLERLSGMHNVNPDKIDFKPSVKETSKIASRSVGPQPSTDEPEKDVLNRERIPREYRQLIKQYFAAINQSSK